MRTIYAQAALSEIVTTMAGRLVPEASIGVSLFGKNLDAAGIVADSEVSGKVQTAIIAFVTTIEQFCSKAIS